MGELLQSLQAYGGGLGALALALVVIKLLIDRGTGNRHELRQRQRAEGTALAAGRDMVLGEAGRSPAPVPCRYEIGPQLQRIADTLDRVSAIQEREVESRIRWQEQQQARDQRLAEHQSGLLAAIERQTQTIHDLIDEMMGSAHQERRSR